MKGSFKHSIEGERIYLREITLQDADNREYCRWMNDKQVTQYTESRFQRNTAKTLRSFISQMSNDDNVFFAIISKDNNKHIGNIKIGPINKIHNFAYVGLIIGDKSYWNKGYGTEVIRLVVDYAFAELCIHKLIAGVYSNNVGSLRAFTKSGFATEGIIKKKYLFDGEFMDEIIFGIINTSADPCLTHSGGSGMRRSPKGLMNP